MNIILASGSPRRKQLLSELGYIFEVRPANIDETIPPQLPPQKAALYLAQKKGAAAKRILGASHCILTADSIVLLGNTILGKPKNKKEAVEMLLSLSGNRHEVHTGFVVQFQGRQIAKRVVSKVSMDTISLEEAEYYVENYKPYDKAGSYAIQEWIGHCKVIKILGSYTNIVGLPTREVYTALQEIGR